MMNATTTANERSVVRARARHALILRGTPSSELNTTSVRIALRRIIPKLRRNEITSAVVNEGRKSLAERLAERNKEMAKERERERAARLAAEARKAKQSETRSWGW
jgi:hypothetical protein